jgi:O-antigen/teichoic acid export membrane protein
MLGSINLILASNILVSACGFFVVVVIARALGPEGRGLTTLFQNGVNLGYALSSFGVSVGALYFVSRRELTARNALEAGLTVTFIAASMSAAAVGLGALLFGHTLRDSGIPYWLLIVAIPLVIQFRVVESVQRSQGRFMLVSILEFIGPLSILVSIALLEAFDFLTVRRAIAAWTFIQVLPLILGYACFQKTDWPRGLAGWRVLRKLLSFGLAGQAGNVVQMLNYRLDSYLVLLFVNTTGVGLYAVGVALSEALWLLANSVAVVLVPQLTASDDEYVARTTPLVCRSTVFMTALGALALGLIAPFLIPRLFGAAFRGSVTPLLWLLPGTVALAGGKVLSAYVFSRGRPLINTGIAFLTLLATVAGDLALIPAFGVKGAAMASSVAYILSLGLTAAAYKRLSGRGLAEALVPHPSDISLYAETLSRVLGRLFPSVRTKRAATPP